MSTQEHSNNRRNHTQRRPFIIPVDTTANLTNVGRRKKSRSPDGRSALRTAILSKGGDTSGGLRKKRHAPGVSSMNSNIPEETASTSDRGRKGKAKSRPSSRVSVENVNHYHHVDSRHAHKKERSKSHETDTNKEHEVQSDSQNDPIGLSTILEHNRLKKELEALRKQTHESKKTIKKQSKVIDELRQEITINGKDLKESELQVEKWKSKSQKSEEVVKNIESNAQCQICIEILFKPFILSPCGHVFCLECLQEWFRKAPADDDDMFEDDNIQYLLHRRKTCPCCRKIVRGRPIPVFVLKSIASALTKFKPDPTAVESSHRSSPITEGDPWEGLFHPLSDDESDYHDADDDDDDDDENGADEDDDDDLEEEGNVSWMMDVFDYGSDDEDPYDGDYIRPAWEPPSVHIDANDYPFNDIDNIDLDLLRRGATAEMLDLYDMEYRHSSGLVIFLEGGNRIFLGWNIKLSGDDETGADYVEWLLEDMDERPLRWEVVEHEDDSWDAHKLVPEDDVRDHTDTDSDNYVDSNDDLD